MARPILQLEATEEEVLELRVQLSRQSLIVRNDQRGSLTLRNHVRHRERFARARDSQEGLITISLLH